MLKNRAYLFLLGALVLGYILFLYFAPQQVNWKPTYSKKHKYPYGNFATYKLLDNIFPQQEISISRQPPYNTFKDTEPGKNFILVTGNLMMDDTDAEQLLEYVEKGSNAFIAAEYYSGTLADTFGLFTLARFSYAYGQADSVTVNFTNPALKEPQPFSFKRYEVQHYFNEEELAEGYTVLGEASDSAINFIRMPFGKGNFYFHANPLVFTNYSLLHKDGHHRYISKSWSYLPVTATVWDEYYNTGREGAQTEIRYILANKNLRWGWFLLLASVGMFFLFRSKRRQRIIPVVRTPANTTLEFVSTVGNLYFQQKDHTNLARKKAAYFLESIRNRYHIKTDRLDQEFISTLSVKSGVDETTVRLLANMLAVIPASETVTESQLLEFNHAIENFNLKSKL